MYTTDQSEKSQRSGYGQIIIAFGLLALAFCLVGCREHTVKAAAPVAVKVKTVETTSVSSGVRYSATIRPQTQVELAFRISGYVDQLLKVRGIDGRLRDVQEGDAVRQGTALARLRQSEYAVKVQQTQAQVAEARSGLDSSHAQLAEAQSNLASSKAQLEEAQAAFEKARVDFERATSLFASQSLTKPEYDAAKAQFEMAEAQRNAARSRVAMADAKINSAKSQIDMTQAKVKGSQAMVTEAAIPLQDTSLRAPMNAIVLQKAVEVGTLVAPGKAGFVIADTTTVKAAFGVPDVMLSKVALGDALTVTTEAMPGREFRGQITRISPAADSQSRVFDVEVTIPNADGALQIGMIATLEVAAPAAAEPVIVIPLSAVVKPKEGSEQYAVFVIEEGVKETGGQPVARLRTVKLGEALGNTLAVLDGVKSGDRVITTGVTLVKDGQAVQIIP